MNTNLIATSIRDKMRGLAFQGIMVSDSFPQIHDMLRRKFGDEYVLLFAQPVDDPVAGTIDWYTPVQGPVQQLTDLPEDEQEAIKEKLHSMAEDIRRYGDQLSASPDPQKVTRGHILNLALMYPNLDSIRVVGGQPVFTCWGFGPGTLGAEPQDLTRLAFKPRKPKAPERRPIEYLNEHGRTDGEAMNAAAAEGAGQDGSTDTGNSTNVVREETSRKEFVVVREGFDWLWLLAVLFLILLLLLPITRFGLFPAISGYSYIPGPALPYTLKHDVAAIRNKNNGDQEELDKLRNDVLARTQQCRPEKPKAKRPDVKPAVPHKLEEPVQNELIIPEKPADTSFAAGLWICDTGLYNTSTQDSVVVDFKLDEKGKGEAVIRERDDTCRAEAKAQMDGDTLLVTTGKAHCEKKGNNYAELTIRCENRTGESTVCYGQNKDGSTWDANFVKAR